MRRFARTLSLLAMSSVPLLFAAEPLVVNPGRTLLPGEMSGDVLVSAESVPETYNGGFSLYVAAWPLAKEYPGNHFQASLFGTRMYAQNRALPQGILPTSSGIEAGLGWWSDTRFATETPKFIMGGGAEEFSQSTNGWVEEWANGPGVGTGRDWANSSSKYGVAQLSPWLLWPPDGLNLKQGTCGQLFGYGYLPLPLTTHKYVTAGKNVPTGDHSWTLFLNTANFKGPVAFFTPYFWSHASTGNPELAGKLLDSRPSEPGKRLSMKALQIPSFLAEDDHAQTYARIAPVRFPVDQDGHSVMFHRVMSYNKDALWNDVYAWLEGGAPADGAINPAAATVHTFKGNIGTTWVICPQDAAHAHKSLLAWTSFATPCAPDPTTFGFKWNEQLVTRVQAQQGGALVALPEYFRRESKDNQRALWVACNEVPESTGLREAQFVRPHQETPEAYVTPEDPQSCWKRPGPVAGPFQVRPNDGSVVTYYWYRFADQPAIMNADLTDADREELQLRVEKMHRHWKKDREYLPPPTIGTLAEIEPALIVTPPVGMEVGYVPIATRQEAAQ